MAYPDARGKTSFSLDVGYGSDPTRPSGSVNVSSNVVGIHLQSSSLDWLVVSGYQFEFQGTGTFNGSSGFSFSLSGTAPSGKQDTLRVRVWDSTGHVVYDNEPSAGPFDYGTQTIARLTRRRRFLARL